MQIINLVRSAGDRFEYPDNVFGYGIPDYWKALEWGRTRDYGNASRM